ncbi:MAG: AgmX/PglI C-terminal domain-containing protein, partial [Sandaracinaceae bacterium]|nr:AgmX/PglI C-terminal domain-containing protein [Sandaracinaceae bacterium]
GVTSLGLGPRPVEPPAGASRRDGHAVDRDGWLALATLRGGVASIAEARALPAASRAGVHHAGWGLGAGRPRPFVPPPARTDVVGVGWPHTVPHCERRYPCGGDSYSCHPCGRAVSAEADAVRRIVARHRHELRFCYAQSPAHAAGIGGRITLRWRVDGSGRVGASEVIGDDVGDPILASCVRAAPEGWRFDELGPLTVTYPFLFTTQ